MTEPDIKKLRAAIDEVDNEIIALLNKRSGFVREVGMTKKKRAADGKAFIRSGREADLVRRIYAGLKEGVFPPLAAAQIWRMIISASLSLEAPLTVTAFAPEAQHEIFWLANEYFGGFTPIGKQPTAKRVLGDVLDGKAEVGILPMPDDSPEGLWWPRLPAGIKIFACVPFLLPKGGSIKALAVAKVDPEPTDDDVSFFSIETDMDVSQSRLIASLDKHKLDVRWVAVENFNSGHRAHLIEIKGFLDEKSAPIQALRAEIGASVLAITWLGAYATPIIYERK